MLPSVRRAFLNRQAGGDLNRVREMRRQITIFQKHMDYWRAQAPTPTPIESDLIMLTTTLPNRQQCSGPAEMDAPRLGHPSRSESLSAGGSFPGGPRTPRRGCGCSGPFALPFNV